MLINTKSFILKSLPLTRGLEFGNETLHFDCGINLSRSGIERAGCYGELWLGPLSQDLFSARVDLIIIRSYRDHILSLESLQITAVRPGPIRKASEAGLRPTVRPGRLQQKARPAQADP